MTPQEINEAVARKLGWISRDFDRNWQRMDIGAQIHIDGPPAYSADIRWAWEIVEYLPDVAIYKWPAGGYAVSIPQANDAGNLSNKRGVQANADTAPMAICQAFLQLPNVPT